MKKECRMEGCSKPVSGQGLCGMHYRRLRLYGDPNTVRHHKYYGLTVEERFWKYVKKTDDCWIWIGKRHRQGYGELWVDGHVKLAHRLSWQIHYTEVPVGKKVLHKCDNPPCVNPDHLFLGTQKMNVDDMWEKGRANHNPGLGESNSRAKLTEEMVREIRRSKEPPRYFTQKYGITRANVWAIRRRLSWQHVK